MTSRGIGAACTIIARNYLSYAKILAQSYLRHHPGGHFYLLVVDGLPRNTRLDRRVRVLGPDALRIADFYEQALRYDVTELCTAVKPKLLATIMDRYDEDAVAYLDPDILITRPLVEVGSLLRSASIVLIPHLLAPIPQDGKKPSEQEILLSGTYNLGFIAVRRSATTSAFLRWWQERLRNGCRIDHSNGLFVDQKWIDLVPGLFASVAILRDPTYNVAYWNLHARRLERDGERLLVDGRPLTFFHFSGFEPREPRELSKHQTRIAISPGSALADLLDRYVRLQVRNGYRTHRRWEYGYARLGDGTPLTAAMRQLYLSLPAARRRRFGHPFGRGPRSFAAWATRLGRTGRRLSPLLEYMYRLRYDIAASFPDVGGKDRARFLEWARAEGLLGADRTASARRGRGPREDDVSPAAARTPGVNVCGYLRTESGVGQAARGYVRALRSLDVPVALRDVSDLSVGRAQDRTLKTVDRAYPHPVNLVCVNADQHFTVMDRTGAAFFRDRYNIGIWAWELPRFPGEWADRFAYYDEIWVGTSFIANGLAPAAPIPVVRIPPPLTIGRPGRRDEGRRRLDVSTECVFLFVFDFHSYVERKNPHAIVEAFTSAFAPTDPVRLVIKCVNAEFRPDAFMALREQARRWPITIHDGYWSAARMADLVAACDAYVSLHRAEGTGLTIADAMAVGKPVIATGWSGNMDFMSVSNSFPVRYELVELEKDIGPYRAGNTWAEPSVAHAAELMRFVFEHRDEAAVRGRAGQADIEARYSVAAVAQLIEERLRAVAGRRGRAHPAVPAPRKAAGLTAAEYRRGTRNVRDVVAASVPAGETVIVVSKGDPELVRLPGHRGWHFPQAADGTYAGYYPDNSAEAIAHLEALRQRGGGYLMVPRTALWWLDHYGDFRQHLESRYRLVVRDAATGVLFDLRAAGSR